MGITRIWPIAVVACVLACGADAGGALKDASAGGDPNQGGGGDPELEQRCRGSIELLREAAEARCECLVASGERPDQASCVAEFVALESDVDCVCSIYAAYPATDAFLDCFVAFQQAHIDCMVDALCDDEQLSACEEGFAGRTACPLPQEAADEVSSMCLPPPE